MGEMSCVVCTGLAAPGVLLVAIDDECRVDDDNYTCTVKIE